MALSKGILNGDAMNFMMGGTSWKRVHARGVNAGFAVAVTVGYCAARKPCLPSYLLSECALKEIDVMSFF